MDVLRLVRGGAGGDRVWVEGVMDLGRMLAEALDANMREGAGYLDATDIRSEYDLTAAAEAFLAKVREAEEQPLEAVPHDPWIVVGDAKFIAYTVGGIGVGAGNLSPEDKK